MSTSQTLSPREAHHHSLMSLIIVGSLAFITGLVFWFVSMNNTVQTPVYTLNQKDSLRAEVASILQNSKVQATQAERSRVANVLSESKVVASPAERSRIISAMENI